MVEPEISSFGSDISLILSLGDISLLPSENLESRLTVLQEKFFSVVNAVSRNFSDFFSRNMDAVEKTYLSSHPDSEQFFEKNPSTKGIADTLLIDYFYRPHDFPQTAYSVLLKINSKNTSHSDKQNALQNLFETDRETFFHIYDGFERVQTFAKLNQKQNFHNPDISIEYVAAINNIYASEFAILINNVNSAKLIADDILNKSEDIREEINNKIIKFAGNIGVANALEINPDECHRRYIPEISSFDESSRYGISLYLEHGESMIVIKKDGTSRTLIKKDMSKEKQGDGIYFGAMCEVGARETVIEDPNTKIKTEVQEKKFENTYLYVLSGKICNSTNNKTTFDWQPVSTAFKTALHSLHRTLCEMIYQV